MTVLDELRVPIVLAPLAGGPSTPELAAAVSEAGGLGFLAAGYLSASELERRLSAARALTSAPLAVNLFVPGSGPADPASYLPFVERLRNAGVEVGEPRHDDDDWSAKLDVLEAVPVAVVSFTFGCPSAEVVRRLHRAGAEAWVTVTSPAEGREAVAAGADVLVAQGSEAGGHRASFVDRPDLESYGVLALIPLLRAAVSVPVVAAGGIANGAGMAAVLAAGARAAQLGTAFMLCPEAGTAPAHRTALQGVQPTVLTRAFTGRLARGIRNAFITEHGPHAPIAYPELHYVTAPMRRAARERGEVEAINLWAGEAHTLATEAPAAEVVGRLAAEAREALAAAGRLLG